MDPASDVDRLSYEIFSILESKFLFGYDDPPKPKPLILSASAGTRPPPANGPFGRVRILSIDGVGLPADALLAAAALARLESSLRRRSGDPSARVADFFDVAAGSGAGGVLAAMLFTRGPDGRPLFAADEALRLVASWSGRSSTSRSFASQRRSAVGWLLRRRPGRLFRRVFGDATLRDTVKPVLIPCYDLATGAAFLFSRADAVEADGYDFRIREVCAATCADPAAAVEMKSADGRTHIAAVGGGVAMGNPTAAAITHVLNNKQEFPFATGVDDLMVLSLGNSDTSIESAKYRRKRQVPSASEIVRIAGEGAADMVDQAVAMAFGHNRTNNYVRIQANRFGSGNLIPKTSTVNELISSLEEKLSHKNVESMLFRGKKISEQTNSEKLEWVAGELIKEEERRKKSFIPIVVLKQVGASRSSSTLSSVVTATTASASTRTSTSPSL
ncbi:patatin-like protein 3 [Canna indica]|uniref:Patatin n=1 Tax=Canna indica TaxID=4628 RepID=A0AAQ3L6J1_9LILI|nr:patatin-like protein 3 [Canna indica]